MTSAISLSGGIRSLIWDKPARRGGMLSIPMMEISPGTLIPASCRRPSAQCRARHWYPQYRQDSATGGRFLRQRSAQFGHFPHHLPLRRLRLLLDNHALSRNSPWRCTALKAFDFMGAARDHTGDGGGSGCRAPRAIRCSVAKRPASTLSMDTLSSARLPEPALAGIRLSWLTHDHALRGGTQ